MNPIIPTNLIIPVNFREQIKPLYAKFVHILRLRHLLYSFLVLSHRKQKDLRNYNKVISIVSGIILMIENSNFTLNGYSDNLYRNSSNGYSDNLYRNSSNGYSNNLYQDSSNYERLKYLTEYNLLLTLLGSTGVNISEWFRQFYHPPEVIVNDWTIVVTSYRINDMEMVKITFGTNPDLYLINNLLSYISPGSLYFDPASHLPKGVEVKMTRNKYINLYQLALVNSQIEGVSMEGKGLIEILNLIFRYNNVLMDSGHFISACPHVWKYIRNEVATLPSVKVTEGFANPFNNNFDQFCCLYSQDQVFGGLDDFFRYNPINTDRTDSKVVMTINPPFIESILMRAGNKVVDWLNTVPNFTGVLLWPYWVKQAGTDYYDEPALVHFLSSEFHYLVWFKILKKFQYNIWVSSTEETIPANFACILLLVSNDPKCPVSPTQLKAAINYDIVIRNSKRP